MPRLFGGFLGLCLPMVLVVDCSSPTQAFAEKGKERRKKKGSRACIRSDEEYLVLH